jgi:hypothetical protein
MRKISVIGASLLLLALGSCSREKESTPADGFVKMRFTAVVGETRTAYENDKTASWVAGDAISVYVTNGTDGQVVNFTAGEDLTFEGSVPAGYETIVAGAYPADAAHTFDANGVSTLHLPASYTLAEGADPASVLPLAGTYADGVMTFRHPAGALKFTIDNVPATAVRFRFTAAGQKVNGSFAMDPALAATEVEAEQSVDITVPAAEGSRSFYVPMPAGELTAGAAIALYDAENNLLFQKAVPQAMTVSKNVIKRIAAVSSWTKNEAWQATYLRDEYSSSAKKVYSKVRISGTTGKYGLYLATRSTFDSKYGSAEGFLASNYIPEKKAAGTNPYTSNAIINYTKMSTGQKVMIIYGVDDDYNFTGEYNMVEFEVPEFTTPADWSMTFKPEYDNNGTIVQAVSVKTDGSSWGFTWMTKSVFASNYGSDPVAAIWKKRTSTDKLRTSKSISILLGTIDEGEYVFLCYGMDERVDSDSDRTPTFKYCLLEVDYRKPTEAYLAWIGTWNVSDDTPETDKRTVTSKKVNSSYNVKGLGKNTGLTVEATFDEETGQMKFKSQPNFATLVVEGETRVISLFGTDGSHYSTGTYDLMNAAFDEGSTDAATLISADPEKYTKYKLYGYVDGQNKYNYGTRTLPSTMTRVVSEGVLMPDGEPAEEEAGLPEADAPVVEDDALPGE